MSVFSQLMAAAAPGTTMPVCGETVLYTPTNEDLPPREIQAIVHRDPPERITGEGRVVAPKMILVVVNDPVMGIASSLLDSGGDTITVAYRPGSPAAPYRIYRAPMPDSDDGASLRLEIR